MSINKSIQYNVFDTNGEIVQTKLLFSLKIATKSGNYLLHKDILRHQLNKKQGTVSTKTRSEVRGGGKKPWRQKGTGRARAGSNRSPLWKGGGVIFGPKPNKINLKINQKERQLAIRTLLYNKRKNIFVIKDLESLLTVPNTKIFSNFCKNYQIDQKKNLLIVVKEKPLALKLATRNLKQVELISASSLNTLSLLKAQQILLTPLSLNVVKETFCD